MESLDSLGTGRKIGNKNKTLELGIPAYSKRNCLYSRILQDVHRELDRYCSIPRRKACISRVFYAPTL